MTASSLEGLDSRLSLLGGRVYFPEARQRLYQLNVAAVNSMAFHYFKLIAMLARALWKRLPLIIPFFLLGPALENVTASSPRPVDAQEIERLEVFPEEVKLTVGGLPETIVVSAIEPSGLRHDVTAEVQFEADQHITLDGHGLIKALQPGDLSLVLQWREHQAALKIEASASTKPLPLSFRRDILPIMSRAGCNGGSCHAKPNGQNSFALSVFASDPKSDYHEVVVDARGRRVFPGFPSESLLLQKATLKIPHKGGKRLDEDSLFYREIVRWIQSGMPYELENEPHLNELVIQPTEGRYEPGSSHQLRVEAHYDDGSYRDITHMAEYAVSDKELIKVSEEGQVRFLESSGEAVILTRYGGHIGQAKVTVPKRRSSDHEIGQDWVINNLIDEQALVHFQSLGLTPSTLCTDSEFIRRAFLDGIGRLPTIDESRSFLADPKPDKRQLWIKRILNDPLYGDFWANKWADLLRPNPDRVGVKSVFLLDRWLRDEFRKNTPYDEFVRKIIEHRGSNHGEGPGVIYRDRRTPTDRSSLFGQLFLGVRMECARCHHHPFERWSQGDYYQFAAFFGPMKQKGAGLSPPISAGTEVFYYRPGGTVKHPITDEVMLPKAPDGPELELAQKQDPRVELSNWLTSADNPYFARAIVNRVWGEFFSRGFVNPVDDFRDSNPPVNQPLLDALAADFVAHGYDLKHLMTVILESRLYQLSSEPTEGNLADTKNFSRYYRKRLPAEVLLDAISDVTRVPESFDGLPPGSRAIETWTYKIQSHFLDAFSRPNSSSDPPNERDTRSSVVQALHLMNSDKLQEKLSAPEGWIASLAQSDLSHEAIITDLYLATYSRYPDPIESEIASNVLANTKDTKERQAAIEDLLWALINTAEFVFNH